MENANLVRLIRRLQRRDARGLGDLASVSPQAYVVFRHGNAFNGFDLKDAHGLFLGMHDPRLAA